jgi:uncharacterized protein
VKRGFFLNLNRNRAGVSLSRAAVTATDSSDRADAEGEAIIFSERFFSFIEDLRGAGIPISPDELAQCARALLLVDWEFEDYFYAALFSTLVKDCAHHALFEKGYAAHFHNREFLGEAAETAKKVSEHLDRLTARHEMPDPDAGGETETANRAGHGSAEGGGSGQGQGGGEGSGGGDGRSAEERPGLQKGVGRAGHKTILDKDFNALTADELKTLEAMVPQIARRLASRMITKTKKEYRGSLDFRRTFRRSLAVGGVPLELFNRPAIKQKPILFVLCDVSSSVWEFSCFSLALVHCLERFFRGVRGFAFVDELDEITKLLHRVKPQALRSQVYRQADVVKEGRTDYGYCLKAFLERYGRELTPNSHLLIFGDARNNWFHSEPQALAALQGRVKRVYWFNPEAKSIWNTGDSVMKHYAVSCSRVFSCSSLRKLEQAFSNL